MKAKAVINVPRFIILLTLLSGMYLFLRLPQLYHLFRTEKSINILIWPTTISRKAVCAFEKKTGYRVNITYFEHYEELGIKLRGSRGVGYDLITVSDYAAEHLIRDGLLKPLDKSKIPFNRIYPQLLHNYFDPNNEYTIPFTWDMYGVGIDRTQYKEQPPASWSILFHPEKGKSVAMLDDAREVILTGAQYLFGSIEALTDKQLAQVRELLIQQKPSVAMYTDMRSDYLLASQIVTAAMVLRSDIAQLMRENNDIDFIIPQEGGFKVIDNVALPVTTKKDEILYEFINYLYQESSYKKNVNKFGTFSVLKDVPSREGRFVITPEDPIFGQLAFFKNVVPAPLLTAIWIDVKA